MTKGANLSHEADLIRDGVQVDLHWQLMRPGRSRGELTTPLLRHRQSRTGIWCLDPSAALLVGLVQPAITKQISGPWSKLIRLIDLDLLIRHPEPDWDWVLEAIAGAGLGPAAWTTLYWLQRLLHTPVPVQVLDRLAPGPLRRAYLRQWIDRELPTRLSPIPFLVQGAFTLALHQGPRDAARAVAGLARAHMEAPSIRRRVEQAATV